MVTASVEDNSHMYSEVNQPTQDPQDKQISSTCAGEALSMDGKEPTFCYVILHELHINNGELIIS